MCRVYREYLRRWPWASTCLCTLVGLSLKKVRQWRWEVETSGEAALDILLASVKVAVILPNNRYWKTTLWGGAFEILHPSPAPTTTINYGHTSKPRRRPRTSRTFVQPSNVAVNTSNDARRVVGTASPPEDDLPGLWREQWKLLDLQILWCVWLLFDVPAQSQEQYSWKQRRPLWRDFDSFSSWTAITGGDIGNGLVR